MRRAYNDYGFLMDENDVFMGISLGYDFTAEHEWGIKDIRRDLGIPELTRRNVGIKSRTVTSKNIKEFMYFGTNKEYGFLIMARYYGSVPRQNARYSLETRVTNDTPWLHPELKNYKQEIESHTNPKYGDPKDPLITAWSGSDFGVVVKGEQEKKWLFELYEAFVDNKACITPMRLSPNAFGNSSLSLVINDRLPALLLQQMKEADKESLDLEWIQNKLKLRERLKKTGKFGDYSLHYCGVKFSEYNPSHSKRKNCRKDNLSVWTNSSDYYGWNTLDEIEELINDKNLTLDEFKSRHK